MSSFQLVSGTADRGRLSGERYSEVTGQRLLVLPRKRKPDVQDVSLPPTDTPGRQLVQKPRPVDWLAKLTADLAYPPKKVSFRLIQEQLAQLWDG